MKKLIILVIILAIAYVGVKLSIGSPDGAIPSATQEVAPGVNGTPADTSTSTATEDGKVTSPDGVATRLISASDISVIFTGYGPGKQETGSVKVKESNLSRTGSIFNGDVTFDMNTITSVPIKDTLIKHLKSTDFFDVAKYPTAKFVITSSTSTEIKGNLTLRGVTQPFILPLSYDTVSGVYSSKVRVNMELFGIKQTFTDKEFILNITVK